MAPATATTRAPDASESRLVAEVAAHSSTMRFGAKMDTAEWSATRRIPSLINTSPAVAVEVAKGHITWFWDGRAIGSVKSRAAVSRVPMTLRFSLVGDQGTERNQTGIVSDWQRGFALSSGKQVIAGPRLKQTALAACEPETARLPGPQSGCC